MWRDGRPLGNLRGPSEGIFAQLMHPTNLCVLCLATLVAAAADSTTHGGSHGAQRPDLLKVSTAPHHKDSEALHELGGWKDPAQRLHHSCSAQNCETCLERCGLQCDDSFFFHKQCVLIARGGECLCTATDLGSRAVWLILGLIAATALVVGLCCWVKVTQRSEESRPLLHRALVVDQS